MHFSSVVLAAALFVTAHGLATPHHGIRSAQRHANIAKARAPAPAPEPSTPTEFFSRRGLKKRCKARVPQGGLAIPEGVGNVASDPADGGLSVGIPVALPLPSPPAESAPEPPKTTTSKPTTTKPKPTKSSEPAPKPTSGGGGGGGDGGSHVGQGTFYATGLTACGITNNDGEMIVAVSKLLFDTYPGYNGANPNNNPICGKKIRANFNGKTAVVTVTDRCEACQYNDLDFTPTGFQTLFGSLGLGRVSGLHWDFV